MNKSKEIKVFKLELSETLKFNAYEIGIETNLIEAK
jgi:hypothetical protein